MKRIFTRTLWLPGLGLISLLFLATIPEGQLEFSSNPMENPIRQDLLTIKGKGILFGHQDDLAYGVDWHYQPGASDVKRVAGDYPALFGWELGGIERGDAVNLDSVPFDKMKELALGADAMGGINTFSWHPYEVINGKSSWTKDVDVVRQILPGAEYHEAFKLQLDCVAAFLTSMRREDGSTIPFIFRPWHEMDGNWFWWGDPWCSRQEFHELFAFTVSYLRNTKGVDNMLVAYSPDRNFNSPEEYLKWYPGDDYVDILGVDNYHDLKQKDGHLHAIRKLHIVIEQSKEKNKLCAFTETGLENVTDPSWYPDMLGAVLRDSLIQKEISYVMVWRNDPKVHFFFPYPGHPGAEGARRMLADKSIFLLEDFNRARKAIETN